MEHFPKSHRLENVRYEIRGPVLQEAMKMDEAGHQIIKLNIGNPAPFGFEAPDEIVMDIIRNLPTSQGYCDSKGLYSARKAIVQYYQSHGIRNLDVNDVYIGNGVSELILMTMQALLNDGDEILIPAPDYPLWTAAATLSGGNVRHYLCDESSDWFPDIADIKAKITEKTKAIVIINPNNPTGAVYSQAVLEEIAEIARQHNLMIFADEIYEKIVYDGAIHHHMAAVAPDVFCVTFNGLSKAYRVAGFRQGWMILTGNKKAAAGFIDGLNTLSSMRLCANTPMQHGIQAALGGYQSIDELIVPGGRLYDQSIIAAEMLNDIDGVSCVRPKGSLYVFPKLDIQKFNIRDDVQFARDFLAQEKVLIVQGTGFNWIRPDHFRVVTLPHQSQIEEAIERLARFLHGYRQ